VSGECGSIPRWLQDNTLAVRRPPREMTVQQHIESFKADDHRARLVAEMRTERLSQRPGPRDKTEGEGVCGLGAVFEVPLSRRLREAQN
jgi:hypothetical protein